MASYIPALKYHVFTRFYDIGIRLTMPETRIKRRLIEDALIPNDSRVLDLGCGTGTLLVMGMRIKPRAKFVGLDPDLPILSMARRKIRRAGVLVPLQAGSAAALPYRDSSFDLIVSSLVLHHLSSEGKGEALREVHRVLRPGGAFHLLDFGAPSGPVMKILSFLVERIGREHVRENFGGMIPRMVSDAGLHSVVETAKFDTVFGTVRIFRGIKKKNELTQFKQEGGTHEV